jgi:hypothetical protein
MPYYIFLRHEPVRFRFRIPRKLRERYQTMIVQLRAQKPILVSDQSLDLVEYDSLEEFGKALYTISRQFGEILVPSWTEINGEGIDVSGYELSEIWAFHEFAESTSEEYVQLFLNLGIHSDDPTEWQAQYEKSFVGLWPNQEEFVKHWLEEADTEWYSALKAAGITHVVDYDQLWEEMFSDTHTMERTCTWLGFIVFQTDGF